VRFHKTFTRQKGVAGTIPAIGSDAVPTATAPTMQDNVMSCRVRDIAGWPTQRIVVGWTTNGVTPVALNGSLYIWEEAIGYWFLINATPLSIPPNQLVFFDVVGMIEQVASKANVLGTATGGSATGQSIDVMLVVADPGAAVNGTYQIGMGPDLTTVGT
jgi:hypothetical protein